MILWNAVDDEYLRKIAGTLPLIRERLIRCANSAFLDQFVNILIVFSNFMTRENLKSTMN